MINYATTAGMSVNLPSNNKIGTAGRTLPGMQVKLRRIFDENTGDEVHLKNCVNELKLIIINIYKIFLAR